MAITSVAALLLLTLSGWRTFALRTVGCQLNRTSLVQLSYSEATFMSFVPSVALVTLSTENSDLVRTLREPRVLANRGRR